MKKRSIQILVAIGLLSGGLLACGGGTTPTTTANLSGILFDDLNKNGSRETGENGLKDWTVYIDSNGNGSLDTAEKRVLTTATGGYSFTEIPTGANKIGVQMRLGYSSAAGVATVSSGLKPQIINGTPVASGVYPFQVALVTKADGSQFCGASLVAPRWVLTAAHCFFDKSTQVTFAKDIQVRVNAIDLSATPVQGETIDVAEILNHEQYLQGAAFNNDIALLKLSTAATQGDFIIPARASENQFNAAGTLVKVIGWGKTETGNTSNILLQVPQEIAADAICKEKHNSTDKMICAKTPNGDTLRESCQGDSGGPLFTQALPLRQVGVVSFGSASCKEIETPGVYAKVTEFDAWLGSKSGRAATDATISFNLSSNSTTGGIAVQQAN
jgi:secreted trypsin-like serine protease